MNKHAIVIGGGPGGLATAHALARRNWQVTLLERADYPNANVSGPQPRRGAPQSHCLHMLMGAGAAALDAIVPGWRHSIMQHGAVPFDPLREAAIRLPSGWLPRVTSGITMYACSRTLLERVLHEELGRYPKAQVIQNSQVFGLDIKGTEVTGVQVASGETLGADLVVDVSGTASRLPQWMAYHDLWDKDADLPETVVDSPWQYASRWVRLAAGQIPDWQCLTAAPERGGQRAAMMLRAEGDLWNVVLLGRDGQVMPQNDAQFSAFTASLAEGRLNAALKGAEIVSPIHHYGRTKNRLRHLERLPHWPKGLAMLGDSVMTLDPYFGLGMTNAARAAVVLADHVDQADDLPFDGACFQKALADLNASPWQLVTGRDLQGVHAPGDAARLAEVYAAAPSSPTIARAILEVQHLLRPVDSLTREIAA